MWRFCHQMIRVSAKWGVSKNVLSQRFRQLLRFNWLLLVAANHIVNVDENVGIKRSVKWLTKCKFLHQSNFLLYFWRTCFLIVKYLRTKNQATANNIDYCFFLFAVFGWRLPISCSNILYKCTKMIWITNSFAGIIDSDYKTIQKKKKEYAHL